MISTVLRPMYPREGPGTHCTGGLVDLRASVDSMENLALWTAWKISPSLASDPWTDYTILATVLNCNTNYYYNYFENLNFCILLSCVFLQVWMSKGPGCDVPIHVIMLALYIELQLGVYSLTAVSYSHNSLGGGRWFLL